MRNLTPLLFVLTLFSPGTPGASVRLVTEGALPPPAVHGLERLTAALTARGLGVTRAAADPGASVTILAGVLDTAPGLRRDLTAAGGTCPTDPEALAVRHATRAGRPLLLLAGADGVGLMYAALDAAERVAVATDPLAALRELPSHHERPAVAERAVSLYTMQRARFERRLLDADHWRTYFDLLARSRINAFVVIFGYENGGFMAPAYPYFFDLADFPGVRLVGITTKEQARNTAAFRRMIALAHEHGIRVTAGIWDHIYRGGVQGGGIPGASEQAGRAVPGLVTGVTGENLTAYNQAGLKRFLEVFPGLDGLQLRMHGESGLRRGEMGAFWHEVFAMIRRTRPELRVDLRAKQLPDAIIADALDQGLDARIATKYWMEQMGLPFHPTHVNPPNQHDRRHGYADLLRYPQRYRVHWRLWNGGTTRLLLWADPEYVRRFAASTRLYGGDSFEINEMLATYMLGRPHDEPPRPLFQEPYRGRRYPFERYAYFYQVWGRAAYDPNTPEALWDAQFAQRLGAEAGPRLRRALHLASGILPRIVAACYPYRGFPTTRGWAEMQRLGDLPNYARAEGSDVQQFESMRDYARRRRRGGDSPRRSPLATSAWFEQRAKAVLALVDEAVRAAGSGPTPEVTTTVTDLRILAHLARYHSRRLRAGVAYNLYDLSGDRFALDEAVAWEGRAVTAWADLVAAAGRVYAEDLPFGVHAQGFPHHWAEELAALRRGLAALEAQRDASRVPAETLSHIRPERVRPGEELPLRLCAGAAWRQPRLEVLAPDEATPSLRTGRTGCYEAVLRVPARTGTLRYRFALTDPNGRTHHLPERGVYTCPISRDADPPRVTIAPVAPARPGADLRVVVEAQDPSGSAHLQLRYRHLTQFEDYRSTPFVREADSDRWSAVIPGDFVDPQWDLMFFVEAIDAVGNGAMFPDLDETQPYVVVPLHR